MGVIERLIREEYRQDDAALMELRRELDREGVPDAWTGYFVLRMVNGRPYRWKHDPVLPEGVTETVVYYTEQALTSWDMHELALFYNHLGWNELPACRVEQATPEEVEEALQARSVSPLLFPLVAHALTSTHMNLAKGYQPPMHKLSAGLWRKISEEFSRMAVVRSLEGGVPYLEWMWVRLGAARYHLQYPRAAPTGAGDLNMFRNELAVHLEEMERLDGPEAVLERWRRRG